METITVCETQDRKSVNREVRRISNTSFLVFATVMNAVFGYWEWLKI